MQPETRHLRGYLPGQSVRTLVRAPIRAGEVASAVSRSLVRGIRPRTIPGEQIMAHHAKTFHFASFFLPESERAATISLYAFFRTLDDLVDERGTDGVPNRDVAIELADWRKWIDSPGTVSCPRPEVGEPLRGVVETYTIPWRIIADFLDGLNVDLDESFSFETVADVERYSYQVASTVGLAMAHVFGATSPAALDSARRLGIAMQLTNILRDVGGDLRRGRIYLPRQEMERVGLVDADLYDLHRSQVGPDERLIELIKAEIARADDHYSAGMRGIPLLPSAIRLPITIAALLYQRILRALERNGFDSLRCRVATSRWEKLALTTRCVVLPPVIYQVPLANESELTR
jgi:15-cis-phytoene synthase